MKDYFKYKDMNVRLHKEGDFELIYSDQGMNVAVYQEKIDYDMQRIGCYAFMPPDEVRRLRDWLNAMLAVDDIDDK